MSRVVKPEVATASHPRRTPAHQSVSLRKEAPSVPNPDPQPVSQPSSYSSSLVAVRNSSGESSNVEHWFDKSNQHVNNRASLDDSDSPFTLGNITGGSPPQRGPPHSQNRPLRPPLILRDSGASSSDEYRSVIDDLTVENKRLKRKLKKYEKARDSPLQSDKLFEVKVLGLPPDKKRELEETLRRFAASLDKSPDSGSKSDSVPAIVSGPSSTKHALKPATSHTSTRFADSGYGSMVPTGKESATHSAQGSHASNQVDKAQANPRSIQSYLHDIPEGLLPKHATAMSEKSKKKMVVRRLEQIFGGGRGAGTTSSGQPQQQQEVSQSAAEADRRDLVAHGHNVKGEGIREARIMDLESEDSMESATDLPRPENGGDTIRKADAADNASNPTPEQSSCVEQRPTRPLDLDPHRTQVPSENIEYIKHLGFLDSNDQHSTIPPPDDQNWIYLNLLVNMAQLHTINVTMDFVKQSIAEYSNKIELSSDGRKVRWRDDRDALMLSDNTTPEHEQDSNSGGATEEAYAGMKRARPSDLSRSDTVSAGSRKKQLLQGQERDKFAYTPIFKHEDSSDSDDESNSPMVTADVHGWVSSNGGRTTARTSSGGLTAMKRTSSSGARPEDGAITFYSKAPFYTDLSGDKAAPRSSANPTNAHADAQPRKTRPLGVPRTKRTPSLRSSVRGSEASAFDVSSLSSSLDFVSGSIHDLSFPLERSPPRQVTFAEPEQPMEFEASGIGGVTPEDNIAITVVRQYRPSKSEGKPNPKPNPPSRLKSILAQNRQGQAIRGTNERVLSTHKKQIEPSPLPPASLHFGENDDSDSDSNASYSDSDSEELETLRALALADQQSLPSFATPSYVIRSPASNMRESSESTSEENDGDSGEADDQSLDFLATARKADPVAVRAKEREYEAEVAERLAEEIPAGSSAATAGGGSGFTSPEVARTSGEASAEDAAPEGSISS